MAQGRKLCQVITFVACSMGSIFCMFPILDGIGPKKSYLASRRGTVTIQLITHFDRKNTKPDQITK